MTRSFFPILIPKPAYSYTQHELPIKTSEKPPSRSACAWATVGVAGREPAGSERGSCYYPWAFKASQRFKPQCHVAVMLDRWFCRKGRSRLRDVC